jgi:hypothetical protein
MTPPDTVRMAARRRLVYALFLAVAVVSLWVPLYNRTEPNLAGIPFFYWFQIAWIVVSGISVAIAYWMDV